MRHRDASGGVGCKKSSAKPVCKLDCNNDCYRQLANLLKPQVLETALNAYWRNDRAAVSVNAVCVLACISKPSLYREFGSEDGLTAAVLERYRQTVLVRLEALLLGRRGIQGDLLSRIRKDLICRSFLCSVSSSIFFR
jgi:AcrR family transcriptional regulator